MSANQKTYNKKTKDKAIEYFIDHLYSVKYIGQKMNIPAKTLYHWFKGLQRKERIEIQDIYNDSVRAYATLQRQHKRKPNDSQKILNLKNMAEVVKKNYEMLGVLQGMNVDLVFDAFFVWCQEIGIKNPTKEEMKKFQELNGNTPNKAID